MQKKACFCLTADYKGGTLIIIYIEILTYISYTEKEIKKRFLGALLFIV